MQQLEDRLGELATADALVNESFSERVSRVAIDSLRPLMQRLAEQEVSELQEDSTPRRHGLPEDLFELCLQVFDSSEDAIAANSYGNGNRIGYAVTHSTSLNPLDYETRYIRDGDFAYPLIQPTSLNPLDYEMRYIRVRPFLFGGQEKWCWMSGHAGDRAAVARQRHIEQRRVHVDRAGENGELTISIPGHLLRGLEPVTYVAERDENGVIERIYSLPSGGSGRSLVRPDTPIACDGCNHYHGAVYNGIPFVCAMHPYGVEDDACADFENSDRPGYHCDFCGEWHD
jgi:hypothetical protein